MGERGWGWDRTQMRLRMLPNTEKEEMVRDRVSTEEGSLCVLGGRSEEGYVYTQRVQCVAVEKK